jgi:hypothetical protein
MHMLSAKNRSEFLACPQLIRFEFAEGMDGYEPTLLIKVNNLLLKFLVAGTNMQLIFAPIGDGRLLYAVKIADDHEHPATVWSILERSEEKRALDAICGGQPLQIFLFNELAVCVAWAETSLGTIPAELGTLANTARLGPIKQNRMSEVVESILARIHVTGLPANGGLVLAVGPTLTWKTMQNTYVTNRAGASHLNLLDPNEGRQQEELVVWLTDSLQTAGAIRGPQIPKGSGTRELTDILLTHRYGSILFESKALAIFERLERPNRAKLARAVRRHITKAASQLRGAVKELRAGTPILDSSGKVLNVERTAPPHAVILIPDLDLVRNEPQFGVPFMQEFFQGSRSVLHILDPAELLRIVQAAQAVAGRDRSVIPIEAFDYFLMKRAECAVEAGDLCISILHRIE